jgi:hypothetical protein
VLTNEGEINNQEQFVVIVIDVIILRRPIETESGDWGEKEARKNKEAQNC